MADWSFPLGNGPYLRDYLQECNGYGESLIDYDGGVNIFGVGLSLPDWLQGREVRLNRARFFAWNAPASAASSL